MNRGQPYGIHFLTIGASAGDMIVVPRCWRICLLVRLIIPWRLLAWVEMTLPLPVRRNRFLTPDLVFNLGIWVSVETSRPRARRTGFIAYRFLRVPSTSRRHGSPIGRAADGRRYGRCHAAWQPPPQPARATPAPAWRAPNRQGARPLSGREHHDHLPAFEFRLLLDLGHGRHVVAHPVEQLEAKLLVGHLAATKTQRDLDLVALVEESPDRAHFHVVIVIIDHRPELDFLDLDDLLFLARLGGLLLFLVLELTKIEDFTDWGRHVGGDFDEIESRLQRNIERITQCNDAAIFSFLVDQLHLSDANIFVDAR